MALLYYIFNLHHYMDIMHLGKTQVKKWDKNYKSPALIPHATLWTNKNMTWVK